MKSKLILIIFCSLLLVNCKKSNLRSASDLVGTWRLVETYSGYMNGGNFEWTRVPAENSHRLVFTADGQYQRTDRYNASSNSCPGTYKLLEENKLEIVATCYTNPQNLVITELGAGTLILDQHGREGVVRNKYVEE